MDTAKAYESEDQLLINDDLYVDYSDRSRHAATVKLLAKETDKPLSAVARAYEDILARYKQDAVIHDFLPVLVSRKLRQFYRKPGM